MAPATLSRSLVLLGVLALAGCDKIKENLPWGRYSIASTSMEPTLTKGTFVSGESVAAGNLRRGDILFVRRTPASDDIYVLRLVGLPGDRIAFVNGEVMLNSKRVVQRTIGRWTISEGGLMRDAVMLTERFPGERKAHRVLDDGPSLGDNFPELELGADEYFLIGDNRDHAADSRFDEDVYHGVGIVNGADIVRRLISE
jgi:signal peptidase I